MTCSTSLVTCYLVEPRDQIIVRLLIFIFCQKNGKNLIKNRSTKYSQKLLDQKFTVAVDCEFIKIHTVKIKECSLPTVTFNKR